VSCMALTQNLDAPVEAEMPHGDVSISNISEPSDCTSVLMIWQAIFDSNGNLGCGCDETTGNLSMNCAVSPPTQQRVNSTHVGNSSLIGFVTRMRTCCMVRPNA